MVELQAQLRIALLCQRPLEHRPQVGVFSIELPQPRPRITGIQRRFDLFRQTAVIDGVLPVGFCCLGAGSQFFQQIDAQQIVNVITRRLFASCILLHKNADQRLIHQLGQQRERRRRHRPRRRPRKAAAKERQPGHRPLLLCGQPHPRMFKKTAQATVAVRKVTVTAGQKVEIGRDLIGNFGGRNYVDPSCGQFNGQRRAL